MSATIPEPAISNSDIETVNAEFDGKENNQAVCLTEGLTGISAAALNNPVLPSDFDLHAPDHPSKRKWEFANRNPKHFSKAWTPLRVLSTHSVPKP